MELEFALEIDFRGERPGYDYLVRTDGFSGDLFVDSDLSVAVQVALGCQGFLLSARVANRRLLVRTAKFDGFDEKKRPVAESTFISAPIGLALGGELLEVCTDLARLKQQGERKLVPPRRVPDNIPLAEVIFDGDKRIFLIAENDREILVDFIEFCVKLRSGSVIILSAPEDTATDYARMTLEDLRVWLRNPCGGLGSRSAQAVSSFDEATVVGEQGGLQETVTMASSGTAMSIVEASPEGVQGSATPGERVNEEGQKPFFVGRNSFEVPAQTVFPPLGQQSEIIAEGLFDFDKYFLKASAALKNPRRGMRARKEVAQKLEEILRANREIWLSLNRVKEELFKDSLLTIFRVWTVWHLMNVDEFIGSGIVEEPKNIFQGFQAISALIEFGKWAVTVIPDDVRISFSEGYSRFARNAFGLFMAQALEDASWSRPGPLPALWRP